ncbi:MAG: tRNA (adenosine(37)-N6)-dimethylallyltransferase MiaA, partial [Deltaproteobacteria bacterium]
PIVAGGTGLYIKALTEGIFEVPEIDKELRERLRREAEESGLSSLYNKLRDVDPDAAEKIGPANTHRIIRALEIFYMTGQPISKHHKEHAFPERPYSMLKIGLNVERETLYKNIDYRVDSMIKAGFVDEVKGLLDMGYGPDLKGMQAIGYSHICRYIKGEYNLEDSVNLIKRDTRHYAKRQMTWFRRDSEISWFDINKEGCIGDIFSEVGGFAGQNIYAGGSKARGQG